MQVDKEPEDSKEELASSKSTEGSGRCDPA